MDRTHLTRWLIPLPAILFALIPQNAKAEETYNTWTCYQSNTNQWTMQQPLADYQAGLMPNWNDCLAWQNGQPENYVWSYGPSVTTTTTSSSTTTVSSTTTSTTTTELSTTTTSSTTTLPATSSSTTEPVQTSTTTSTVDTTTTTTTTTSTTVPPTPTTTEAPYTPPQTSTAPSPTTEPQPAPTTTEPATTTTEPETTTTVPDETLPEPVEPVETTIPETTVPEIFDESVLDEVEQPKEEEMLLEDTPDTTTPKEEISLSTTIAKSYTESEIEEILTQKITSEQVVGLITNPQVLATLDAEQAETIFEQLDVNELSDEQLEAFTEVIQEAPTEVKKAFEKTIDIFSSKFDDYVPTGSNVPVRTRRTLVVIGSLLTMLPNVHIKTGKS